MSRLITIALLACLPLLSQADDDERNRYRPSAEAMILDGLIVRPLSLAGTVVGAGLFVVTLPFSALGGNVDEAGEALVKEPARATFGPCLGCLPYSGRYHPYRAPADDRDSPPQQ